MPSPLYYFCSLQGTRFPFYFLISLFSPFPLLSTHGLGAGRRLLVVLCCGRGLRLFMFQGISEALSILSQSHLDIVLLQLKSYTAALLEMNTSPILNMAQVNMAFQGDGRSSCLLEKPLGEYSSPPPMSQRHSWKRYLFPSLLLWGCYMFLSLVCLSSTITLLVISWYHLFVSFPIWKL